MREAIPAVIAGMVALVLGAAGTWFVMSSDAAPAPQANLAQDHDPEARQGEPLSGTGGDREGEDPAGTENLARVKAELRQVEQQRDTLVKEKQAAEEASDSLLEEVERLKTRMAELEALAAGPNYMRIGYGDWGEIKELRETDFKDVGAAVNEMNPLLKELADATREGREPQASTWEKIGENNRRILSQYGKILGKLPTHTGYNGEFTHPVYLMNMLAAQLEAAEDPLSDEQQADLVRHGEEYDRRWTETQQGYDDRTWYLQKLLDEAELKEWFIARMFEVTTPAQEGLARPAATKGLIGLDLYSSGLMLGGNIAPVIGSDLQSVRASLRSQLMESPGLTEAQLDASGHVFDDWMAALPQQLVPRAATEAQFHRTAEAISSGRAQLTALKALESAHAVTDEDSAKYRSVRRIAIPLVVVE
jgi:hypothetical protein